MKIADKFGRGKTLFSLEVFPPKKDSSIEGIYKCIDEVSAYNPDYISVTFGAAGSSADTARSVELTSYIQNKGITASMHLTCIASSESDIISITNDLKARGIDNILVLRGDMPADLSITKHDFAYASDLAKFVSKIGGFGISGACYPEMHREAASFAEDIKHLKIKVENGVSHLVSQLFFDNEIFYDFREKLAIAGIDVPLDAGIMPVTNAAQIQKMVTMCGASIPPKLARIITKFGDNPEAMADAGISYAIDQITDLIASDVDGIHLYAMNNANVVRRIHESINSQL
ncbi:MAG: methylenetetrahydrofolate reductase [NAD(P)H] [Ruminococcus sp.]|jgi:methylenetetrahydrofolate reductase (NADPH)|nr:methylenetetrahydrofolate reductase [NAD(P)H] [Ruminococcus sp.]